MVSSCVRGSLVRSVLAALGCSLFAAGCGSQAAPTSNAPRPVKTMLVTSEGGARVRSFPGKVEASRRVELAFQVSGLLVDLPVKEGQQVAKGEVIAQLRQDEFKARLATVQGQLGQARAALSALQQGERPEERLRREAQVRAAEARLENARATYQRTARLLQTRAVTREAYDADAAAYRVAQEDYQSAVQLVEKGTIGREEDIAAQMAAVRGLEGQVVEADLQLQDSTLRAPYDGVIARRFVEQNQNVRAKDPIVQFQDVDEIDIAVDVPETVMAADLRSADIVQMAASFASAPGLEFPVRIREMAQVADPTTQTFQIRVAMPAPSDIRLLPGMTATVTMSYRRASILGSRLLVPIAAIAKTEGGEQVAWIVGADQVVSRRAVRIGGASGGQVEVLAGLAAGDRIAAAGVSFLREGMKVRDLASGLGGPSGGGLR